MEDVTLAELRERLDDEALTVLDVRTALEFEGAAGAHCDPRQGHIPGAVNVPLERILECRSADGVRGVVGLPEGCRDRRVLPLRKPVALRRGGARRGGLQGAQLRRVLARVVARGG